jgi:hypothetical protein
MYIPLNSADAGMGQRFLSEYKDIQDLRDAWVSAVHERKWSLAAMYQLDLDKRRDQMILHAIERSEGRITSVIIICGVVLVVVFGALIRFR